MLFKKDKGSNKNDKELGLRIAEQCLTKCDVAEPIKNEILRIFGLSFNTVSENYQVIKNKRKNEELAYITLMATLGAMHYTLDFSDEYSPEYYRTRGIKRLEIDKISYKVRSDALLKGINFPSSYEKIKTEVLNLGYFIELAEIVKKNKKADIDCKIDKAKKALEDYKRVGMEKGDSEEVFKLAYSSFDDWYYNNSEESKLKFEELRGLYGLWKGIGIEKKKNKEAHARGVRISWKDSYFDFMKTINEDIDGNKRIACKVLNNAIEKCTNAILENHVCNGFDALRIDVRSIGKLGEKFKIKEEIVAMLYAYVYCLQISKKSYDAEIMRNLIDSQTRTEELQNKIIAFLCDFNDAGNCDEEAARTTLLLRLCGNIRGLYKDRLSSRSDEEIKVFNGEILKAKVPMFEIIDAEVFTNIEFLKYIETFLTADNDVGASKFDAFELDEEIKMLVDAFVSEITMTLKKSPMLVDLTFELLPLTYIVVDYAIASSGNEIARYKISPELEKYLCIAFDGEQVKKFSERKDLYGNAIRGMRLRDEWSFGNMSKVSDNAIIKCGIVFGDILINPASGDDYLSAPMRVRDIFLVTEFAEKIMKPTINAMTHLFMDVYDLYS